MGSQMRSMRVKGRAESYHMLTHNPDGLLGNEKNVWRHLARSTVPVAPIQCTSLFTRSVPAVIYSSSHLPPSPTSVSPLSTFGTSLKNGRTVWDLLKSFTFQYLRYLALRHYSCSGSFSFFLPLPFFSPLHSSQPDCCQASLIGVLPLVEKSSLRYSSGSAFFGSAWLLGGRSVGGCSVVCKFSNHGLH